MPAAVLVPLVTAAISGGAAVTGAVMANRAAGNAARTQADASREAARLQSEANDKAIAAQREQEGYDRQRQAAQEAARAPYVNASNQSLAALAERLKLPSFDPQGKPPMIQPTGNFQPPDLSGNQTYAMPRPDRQMTGSGMGLAQYGAQPQVGAQAGGVLMVAPTGERQVVPANKVAYYEARGAKRA